MPAQKDTTYHSPPVERLLPPDDREPPISAGQWLAEMEDLARDIGSLWPEGVSAVEAIQEQRRDL